MNHVLNSYHCKLSQKLESIFNYPCSIETFQSYLQFLFKIFLLKSRLVIFIFDFKKTIRTEIMKLIEPSNFHVIDEPLDAIDVIRQRSISGDVDEEPLYLCDISDIIKKHQIWKQSMPRVLPFYGKS